MSDGSSMHEQDGSGSGRRSRRDKRGRAWIMWLGIAGISVAAIVLVTTLRSQTQPSAGPAAASQPAVASSDCAGGNSFYVAPDGVKENDGSLAKPLDLATALSGAGPARPCDTVWVRGGTYRGAFDSTLRGKEGAPIIVRQMVGERATIDSAPEKAAALSVGGEHVWFWGLEVTNSHPQRSSKEAANWPEDLSRASGVLARGTHLKFINMVVHDMTRGFEIADAIDVEVYGSLIYYNGWDGPQNEANGHGIDTRNRTGQRRLIDNIIFDQFGYGISSYSATPVVGMMIVGNILFNNGSLSKHSYERDILVGGAGARAPVLKSNMTFGGAQTHIGYGAGCTDADIEDNYLASSSVPLVLTDCSGVVKGNTMFGNFVALQKSYPDNTFYESRPTGLVVKTRPNQYEPGRANLAVYNWDKLPGVELNLSGLGLSTGEEFEIRDARNFYGAVLGSGKLPSNSKVSIRVDKLSASTPVGTGLATPSHTGPDFLALVVMPNRPRPRS